MSTQTLSIESAKDRTKRDKGTGSLIPPIPGVTSVWSAQVYDKNGKAMKRSLRVRGALKSSADPKSVDSWTNITAAKERLKRLVK